MWYPDKDFTLSVLVWHTSPEIPNTENLPFKYWNFPFLYIERKISPKLIWYKYWTLPAMWPCPIRLRTMWQVPNFKSGKINFFKHKCDRTVTLSISWHFLRASPHLPSLWFAAAHSTWNHIHCISFRLSMAVTPSYKMDIYEPRQEKTCLRCLWPGATQTDCSASEAS